MKKLVIDHNQVLQVDDMTAGTSDTSRAITRPCPKRPAPSVCMLSAPIRVPRVLLYEVFSTASASACRTLLRLKKQAASFGFQLVLDRTVPQVP